MRVERLIACAAGVGVDVGVAEAAAVAVGVALGTGDRVGDGLGVGLAVGVGVGVGSGEGVGVAPGAAGNGQTCAPLLRVQSESVVNPRSYCMSQIIECGGPFSNRSQTGVAAVM